VYAHTEGARRREGVMCANGKTEDRGLEGFGPERRVCTHRRDQGLGIRGPGQTARNDARLHTCGLHTADKAGDFVVKDCAPYSDSERA